MTALAEKALSDRLRRLRHELAGIDGLVRAHPLANKHWLRLVADISESANGLEALLVGIVPPDCRAPSGLAQ